jgi:hypothetical protein
MKINFGSCSRARLFFIVIFALGWFIVIFSSKLSVQLITGLLLSIFAIVGLTDKYPTILYIDDQQIELTFCKFFGMWKKKIKLSNQDIYFLFKKEPYNHGMRFVLKVYYKNSNKLLFKIADDINGKENVELTLGHLRKTNVQEFKG